MPVQRHPTEEGAWISHHGYHFYAETETREEARLMLAFHRRAFCKGGK